MVSMMPPVVMRWIGDMLVGSMLGSCAGGIAHEFCANIRLSNCPPPHTCYRMFRAHNFTFISMCVFGMVTGVGNMSLLISIVVHALLSLRQMSEITRSMQSRGGVQLPNGPFLLDRYVTPQIPPGVAFLNAPLGVLLGSGVYAPLSLRVSCRIFDESVAPGGQVEVPLHYDLESCTWKYFSDPDHFQLVTCSADGVPQIDNALRTHCELRDFEAQQDQKCHRSTLELHYIGRSTSGGPAGHAQADQDRAPPQSAPFCGVLNSNMLYYYAGQDGRRCYEQLDSEPVDSAFTMKIPLGRVAGLQQAQGDSNRNGPRMGVIHLFDERGQICVIACIVANNRLYMKDVNRMWREMGKYQGSQHTYTWQEITQTLSV